MQPTLPDRIRVFKAEFVKKYQDISNETTPQVDGTGKKIIQEKGHTGQLYIDESYMRAKLDQHFPGWSWEMAAPLNFLGSEWVVAQGHLIIIDENLLGYGVNPPIRKFYGVDSVRIQFRTCDCSRRNNGNTRIDCKICNGTGKLPHLPENIIDIGDNCKQAVTSAMKVAINRMCHIGDDIYGKRMEFDGAGNLNEILESAGSENSFMQWLQNNKIRMSQALEIIKKNDISEIIDFGEAMRIIKIEKGIK